MEAWGPTHRLASSWTDWSICLSHLFISSCPGSWKHYKYTPKNALRRMICKAVSLTRMELLLLMPTERYLPKLHQDVCSQAVSSSFPISREGDGFLALFGNPRCVLQLFKDLPFTYCTCVIKDPIKSSDFLCFCPGLWRKWHSSPQIPFCLWSPPRNKAINMFSFVDICTGKSRELQVVRFLSYFITKQQEENSRGAFLAIQGTTMYLFFLPKVGAGGSVPLHTIAKAKRLLKALMLHTAIR